MSEKEQATEVLKAKGFDTIHDLIDDLWGIIDANADGNNFRIATLVAIYGVVVHTMDMIEALQNGE